MLRILIGNAGNLKCQARNEGGPLMIQDGEYALVGPGANRKYLSCDRFLETGFAGIRTRPAISPIFVLPVT